MNLSNIERQVAEKMMSHKTNMEIASELSLSEQSVRAIISHLIIKTNASSRQGVVHKLFNKGL